MTLATVDRYDSAGTPSIEGRAVVVGGSIAGLCAARVLADVFKEVVVLERDALPDEPVARTGAPQTSHPHALLEAGRATMEDLFSGFGEEILAAGGLLIDSGSDMAYYDQGGYVADTTARLPTYCASRALFEYVVRKQVQALDGVRIKDDTHMTGYLTDEEATAVTGVAFRNTDGAERQLPAALTVDATGRTSRTPQWLSDHGYEAPPVDEVHVDVTYSTIRIERPPDDRRVFFVPPSSPRTRGSAIIPIEDDQWEVIIQGVHGDTAPTEPGSFTKFVDSLPVAEPGQLVTEQSWRSDTIDHYPYPSSRRHRYETLDRFPEGLVVTGDAIASFNPIYGQGMSVAALDAVELHHALKPGIDGVASRFFDRAATVVDAVWRMAVGADFGFPQTTGPKPRGADLSNWYFERLLRRSHTDPTLSEAFMRVMRLEQPPATLLKPGIARRVLQPTPGTSELMPRLKTLAGRGI
ncbi:FAD-dependent monooxygenase [Halostella sp. JP-L12]|uniref:FAD-dependent oxidoreductase n=1 Tax=Halostella TaxID=1843185 RepID=UPI000EF8333A|nr:MULTISPECIES: FAD-dependent monooxygenase [Halostella]NHN49298.1 FAD-dependent monooxygenase [Halostella sp. JP-L12]